MKFNILRAVVILGIFVIPLVAVQAQAQKKKQPKPNAAMAAVEDVEGLPRVLLIGDSISIGYTVAVRELMKGKANVHRPRANCGPTKAGLAQIDQWLATGGEGKKWDVIHFNWGLHDLKYLGPKGENLADPADPGSRQQVPPETYEKNLNQLVERMKETGAKLIWCSTTPVPEGAKGRVAGDSAKYNAIAAKVMKLHGVATDDLFSLAKPQLEKIQRPANVHFSPEGSKVLAGQVAASIEKVLGPE